MIESSKLSKYFPPKKFFLRKPWENTAIALIVLGIFMLMQPFFMGLFTYSFIVILTGTLGFVVVSHFPDQ